MTSTLVPADVSALLAQSPAAAQWEKVGIRHHHGIDLSLGSLHTAQSAGIGEFPDLLPLIDWCHDVGFDVLQLLPLNDSGLDPSPYNALTAFALNPIYLGVASLPHLCEDPEMNQKVQVLQKLTSLPRVAYHEIYQEKEELLRLYWKKHFAAISRTQAYQEFLEKNPWVKGYALFKMLQEKYGTNCWSQWPSEVQLPSPELFEHLWEENRPLPEYHVFVQFLCFEQWKAVKSKAASKQVFLKGDLPILISGASADVWQHRQLFHTDVSAGAPPDFYNKDGQNWGFPIYNWEAAEKEDFAWWKQRLAVAAELYDLYRLDHVVGFFRIWAIPPNKTGRDGAFVPTDESTWLPQGKKILLMMLQSCPLLPIGEDLGMIPPEVRTTLTSLGIPGTKVMRWERKWSTPEQGFIDPQEYAPISMTTVSTHDSEPLALWWESQETEARDFAITMHWNYEKKLTCSQQQQLLWNSHHTTSLFHINLLQEYLTLIPGMTHDDLSQERINVPGTFAVSNWTYRLRPDLETLVRDPSLKEKIRQLLSS